MRSDLETPHPQLDDKETAALAHRDMIVPAAPPAPAGAPPRRGPRRFRILIVVAAFVVFACFVPLPAFASMFGEENTTLVQMLVQALRLNQQVAEVSNTLGKVADYGQQAAETYARVNAGINELKNYSFEAFVTDVKTDVYNQYPGFAKLENASQNLAQWEKTRAASPFTAYEAITAVAGDLSKSLRADVAAGRVNVDRELVLAGEASGGFAAAHTAEQVTERFDRDIATLERLARHASPGEAAQIAARADLMIAAQNSYLMRLVARTVRLDSVAATMEYAKRIEDKNAAYDTRDFTAKLAVEASKPPALIRFDEEEQP
jgi:hypothetical protein